LNVLDGGGEQLEVLYARLGDDVRGDPAECPFTEAPL
jgi:hypothetical protein